MPGWQGKFVSVWHFTRCSASCLYRSALGDRQWMFSLMATLSGTFICTLLNSATSHSFWQHTGICNVACFIDGYCFVIIIVLHRHSELYINTSIALTHVCPHQSRCRQSIYLSLISVTHHLLAITDCAKDDPRTALRYTVISTKTIVQQKFNFCLFQWELA